ncbi:MAG: autotransporter outer membrane beta-barrel domain-containing protein [Candidatus Tectomicrobia bacterium]|nr:autotransporter outer membrane beta-barrel domain-containing protein [Candidatus Tectomicrobia bacterium]
MQSGRSAHKTCLSLLLGLTVLAITCSPGGYALAQMQIPCPLPPGASPPSAPAVTAAQVEDGRANLMEFVVAARDQYSALTEEIRTLAEVSHFGCLIRQEGSHYRSGSTYLVSLRPDGRIILHARAMTLSGRQLNPRILAAILSSLGVERTVLADMASRDPAVRASALRAALQTLVRRPDARFDATSPGPGGQSGIPGASGHAAVYTSANLGIPIIVVAGFDVDESHLAVEAIDSGDPEITAADVVDRETLRAFVNQAGAFYIASAQEQNGDHLRTKNAMRDPNGPWIHGNVYVHIVDRISNVILFHGAFPNRLELRPPGITRDNVTGELVFDQLVAAATSSPEGGFWEYHFDDPTDERDDAGVPKVGFARVFTGEFQRADGADFPIDIIVASGFYPPAPEGVVEGPNATIKALLPQVMRAMTASTVDAISARIRQATSGSAPDNRLSLGGASTLSGVLLANGQALEDGTLDLHMLLADSSFTLAANGGGGSGLLSNLTLWGSGDYRSFSGGNPESLDYDGDVISANLGVDTRLSANVLAGFSVALARGTVNYTDAFDLSGEFNTTLTSVNPYVGWQGPGGTDLWAAAGYGAGEVEVNGHSDDSQARDLTQRMLAAGLNWPLAASEDGATTLRLKAETAFTWADVEAAGMLDGIALHTSRQRLMLEGSRAHKLASGATLAPSLEFGLRHDGGDGDIGGSMEAGGALRYADVASGLTVEGRARILFSHSSDYEEWGVSGLIRYDPGAAGRGLTASVQPAWGRTASGVRRMWESGAAGESLPVDVMAPRVNAEIGYGIDMAPGLGVVTPFAGTAFSGEDAQLWRMGARWQVSPEARLNLEGARRDDPYHDEPEHSLMLTAAMLW